MKTKITNRKLLPELVVKRGEVQMLKILHESSVVDNIYSLIELKRYTTKFRRT